MFNKSRDKLKASDGKTAPQQHSLESQHLGHVQHQEAQPPPSVLYTASGHGSASAPGFRQGQTQQKGLSSAGTRNPYKEPRVLGLLLEYPENKSQALHAAIDIIAIPGLSAFAPRTWYAYINGKDEEDGNICWLSDRTMLPSRIPDSRIMTYNWSSDYQGRDVSQGRFTSEADTMLDRIHLNRQETKRSQRPIIFICSCFGGLLLAKALVRALRPSHPDPKVKHIVDHTVGIVTLGTPFRGSWEFGYANAEARIAMAKESGGEFSWELVQYLRPDKRGDADANGRPSPLDDIVQEFAEMIQHNKFRCPVVNFFETRPASYDAFSRSLPQGKKPKGFNNATGSAVTVPQASAVLDGIEQVGLDVRHNMMWKLNTPENDGFVRISSRISNFARDANHILRRKAESQEAASLTLPGIVAEYLDAGTYFTKQKTLFNEKRSPGTCLSYINSEKFSTWRDQPRSSTLICLGEPGVGKSVFFSVAVDHLRKQPTTSAMAYVYLDYIELKQAQGNGNFLRSILKQLLMTSPIVPEGASSLYSGLKSEGTQPSETEAEKAIAEIAEIAPGKTFILLDALDECHAQISLDLLSALSRLQLNARLSDLITSRFNDNIEHGLLQVSYMPISGTRNDIECFIKDNMGKVSTFLNRRSSDRVKAKIVSKILETSQGMFELARLQLWSLAGWKSDDDVMSALAAFQAPTDLHRSTTPGSRGMLYERAHMNTLERINSMQDGNPELARRALAWVLYSPVLLSSDELIHALAIKPQNRTVGSYKTTLGSRYHLQDIVAICVGLLTVEVDSVRLAHYTTQQFLAKNISLVGPASPEPGTLSDIMGGLSLEDQLARQHLHSLAVCCIAYLSLDDFIGGHCAEQELTRRLRTFPFYRHAASHFGHYARHYMSQGDDDAASVLISFFGNDQKIRAASQVTRPLYFSSRFHIDLSATQGPLALHYATYHRLTKLANFLLAKGGEFFSPPLLAGNLLTATDAAGYTPLCWAAAMHDEELIALFLQYPAADPDHVSRDGPPVLLSIRRSARAAVLGLLVPRAKTGAVDAMYVAVKTRDEWLVRQLLTRGVDPNLGVDYPELVMKEHDASASPSNRQHESLLRQLKRRGAGHRESPLELAERIGDSHLCQILSIQKSHHRADRWEPYAPPYSKGQ
ncbi:hypothetical protein M3J09_009240 [Ascochyta lentis]